MDTSGGRRGYLRPVLYSLRANPSPEYCARCSRERRPGEYGCPDCGADAYDGVVRGNSRPRAQKKHPLGGILAGLVDLPPGGLVLLHGPRGVGKTTIAMQAFSETWWCSSEMGPRLILEYAHRVKARIYRITRPEWIEPEDGAAHIDLRQPAGEPRDLVLDSVTATKHPAEAMAAARAYCEAHARRAICIVQQTKDGEARGPSTLGFDCDVEIRLEVEGGRRRLLVEKNRYGREGALSYNLGAHGPELPKADRYYSVEGEGGAYRLVAHPAPKAVYAAYLTAAEASRENEEPEILRLPAPPCAVAAKKSALYRGGWIEPEDWEERKAFSEAHGVPYYSPLEAD